MKVRVTKAKANKTTKKVKVELTTLKIADDVSVTIETDSLSNLEYWAEKTEETLAFELFDAARAYEDGSTAKLTIFTEDELNSIMIKAGFAANLFTDNNDFARMARENCIAIIKTCTYLIDVLHGQYDCLKLETSE